MDSFREQVETSRPIHKTQAQIDSENEARAIIEADNAERLIKDAVLMQAKRTFQGSELKLYMGLYVQLPLIGHLELKLHRDISTDYLVEHNTNNPSILVDIDDSTQKPFLRSIVSKQQISLTKSAQIIRNLLIERLSDSGFSFGEWKVSPIPGFTWNDSYTLPRVQFDGVMFIDGRELYPLPLTIAHSQGNHAYLQFILGSQGRKVSTKSAATELVLPFTYK